MKYTLIMETKLIYQVINLAVRSIGLYIYIYMAICYIRLYALWGYYRSDFLVPVREYSICLLVTCLSEHWVTETAYCLAHESISFGLASMQPIINWQRANNGGSRCCTRLFTICAFCSTTELRPVSGLTHRELIGSLEGLGWHTERV